jgi:hypothetical protein
MPRKSPTLDRSLKKASLKKASARGTTSLFIAPVSAAGRRKRAKKRK